MAKERRDTVAMPQVSVPLPNCQLEAVGFSRVASDEEGAGADCARTVGRQQSSESAIALLGEITNQTSPRKIMSNKW